MRVLVTRPEPDAARTAALLAARGHEAVVDPLLRLETVESNENPAGPFDALAATSANALRAAAGRNELQSWRALPLFAVGAHTAGAARAAGFAQVVTADGDAAALADLLARKLPRGARVLHLAGETRARDLGGLLAPRGIAVKVLVLYRMRPADALGASAAALAAGALDAALHFSPRSAATFVALAGRQGLAAPALGLRHCCLSPAVAAPLAAAGARIEVAESPHEAALIELLDS